MVKIERPTGYFCSTRSQMCPDKPSSSVNFTIIAKLWYYMCMKWACLIFYYFLDSYLLTSLGKSVCTKTRGRETSSNHEERSTNILSDTEAVIYKELEKLKLALGAQCLIYFCLGFTGFRTNLMQYSNLRTSTVQLVLNGYGRASKTI